MSDVWNTSCLCAWSSCPTNEPSLKVTSVFSYCHLDTKSQLTDAAQNFIHTTEHDWMVIYHAVHLCGRICISYTVFLHSFIQFFFLKCVCIYNRCWVSLMLVPVLGSIAAVIFTYIKKGNISRLWMSNLGHMHLNFDYSF